MNQKKEHQIFPQVPYYKVPGLREVCRHNYPAQNRTMVGGFAEMLLVHRRQRTVPDCDLRRPLPETENPYHNGLRAYAA